MKNHNQQDRTGTAIINDDKYSSSSDDSIHIVDQKVIGKAT